MKFTKHHHPKVVGMGFEHGRLSVDGFAFSFDDYPQIPLFVFKHPKTGLYCVREIRTGLKAGTNYGEKTRAAAIAKQHASFEAMRNAPNGKGRHAYVVEAVERCVTSTLETTKP